MNEQRLSAALNRPVNLYHERTEDILNELLTYVEQYKAEYQDTVKALQPHLAKLKGYEKGLKEIASRKGDYYEDEVAAIAIESLEGRYGK